jgi:hypothetical protein
MPLSSCFCHMLVKSGTTQLEPVMQRDATCFVFAALGLSYNFNRSLAWHCSCFVWAARYQTCCSHCIHFSYPPVGSALTNHFQGRLNRNLSLVVTEHALPAYITYLAESSKSLLKILVGEPVSRTPDWTQDFAIMLSRTPVAAAVDNTIPLLWYLKRLIVQLVDTVRKFCVDECFAVSLWQWNGYLGFKKRPLSMTERKHEWELPTQTCLRPIATCVCKPEAANTVRALDDERYAARNMLSLQWTVE